MLRAMQQIINKSEGNGRSRAMEESSREHTVPYMADMVDAFLEDCHYQPIKPGSIPLTLFKARDNRLCYWKQGICPDACVVRRA